MEIEGLGKRCALPHCRRLDYLPVHCGGCGADFCDEHKDSDAHDCPARNNSNLPPGLCPQCGGDVERGADALARHLRTECIARRTRVDPRCSMTGCGKRDPLAVACPSCQRTYCITHRHEEVHACAPSSRRKKAPRLPRVDFAKTAAIGDSRIPEEERISVAVHFALAEPPRPCLMFFSLRHSAGRVLDDIVSRTDNLSHPNPPLRFHLYAVRAAARGVNLLPTITPLRDLPKGTLSNGDVLVVHDSPDGLPDAFAKLKPMPPPTAQSKRSRLLPRVTRRRSADDSACTLV